MQQDSEGLEEKDSVTLKVLPRARRCWGPNAFIYGRPANRGMLSGRKPDSQPLRTSMAEVWTTSELVPLTNVAPSIRLISAFAL